MYGHDYMLVTCCLKLQLSSHRAAFTVMVALLFATLRRFHRTPKNRRKLNFIFDQLHKHHIFLKYSYYFASKNVPLNKSYLTKIRKKKKKLGRRYYIQKNAESKFARSATTNLECSTRNKESVKSLIIKKDERELRANEKST